MRKKDADVAVEMTATRRNKDRFMLLTGKTEEDYEVFATQVGRRMHINTLDKLVCEKMGIYMISHLSLLPPTALPEDETWDTYYSYMIEHSENPLELAQLWKISKAESDSWMCKKSIIDEFLTPFPKENFEQHGDKNWLSDVSKSWFDKKGLKLDTQIKEMNSVHSFEEELAIGFDDVIEFVRTYKRNEYRNPEWMRMKEIEARFKEVTTFQLKEYYVEHLEKACCPRYNFGDIVPF